MTHILLRAASLTASSVDRGQCDCNCDCACVSAPSFSFVDVAQSALWSKAANLYSLSLPSDYKIFRPPGNGELAVLDLLANDILNRFDLPLSIDKAFSNSDIPVSQAVRIANQLAALGLLVATEDDCACTARNGSCDSDKSVILSLTSWLHLTDRCNLRCDYCYLPHVREDMSSETGRAAVDAIFRSAKINNFKQVKIKYAGGEPLLRYPLILELHAYAKSLADAHGLILEEVVLAMALC